MSVHIAGPVWNADIQPAAKKLVALCIADASGSSGECWPSMATLSRRCGITTRSARKWVAELEADGWLSRSDRFVSGGGRQTSNLYQWDMDRLGLDNEGNRVGGEGGHRRPGDPVTGDRGTRSPATAPYCIDEPSEEPSFNPAAGQASQGGLEEPPLQEELLPQPPLPPQPKKERARDLVFDAIVEVGRGTGLLTPLEGSFVKKACLQVIQTFPGGTPPEVVADEVRRRARHWEASHPDIPFSPGTIMKNWSLLAEPPRPRPIVRTDIRNHPDALTKEEIASLEGQIRDRKGSLMNSDPVSKAHYLKEIASFEARLAANRKLWNP